MIKEKLPVGKLLSNYQLADLVSYKAGGAAEYFYCPAEVPALIHALKEYRHLPITVLGGGTNVLIRETGIRGLVLSLTGCFKDLQVLDDNRLYVGAGVKTSQLIKKCLELGMEDAAFMVGIPGTIGGALKMNAGSCSRGIWDYVVSVTTIDRTGDVKTKEAQSFTPGYRKLTGLSADEWFIGAIFSFNLGLVKNARNQARINFNLKRSTQPLEFPSCGSVFLNPVGEYAAKLIENCGLKGRRIGGALVSPKHANFIVNYNNATSTDIENLIKLVIEEVYKQYKITLVPEVKILGG